MLNLTILRTGRPLDKTLGLAGLRKWGRRNTAQQRLDIAAKAKERRKRAKERHKRCARRSSSDLEVAGILCALQSRIFLSMLLQAQ